MNRIEKVAEEIRCAVTKHKNNSTVMECIAACEIVKLELFEMLPQSMANVAKDLPQHKLFAPTPKAK